MASLRVGVGLFLLEADIIHTGFLYHGWNLDWSAAICDPIVLLWRAHSGIHFHQVEDHFLVDSVTGIELHRERSLRSGHEKVDLKTRKPTSLLTLP